MTRHLLHLHDLTPGDLHTMLDVAMDIKQHPENYYDRLRGRTLALLFEKNSTRTHLSFEIGMKQLGGFTVYMRSQDSNLRISDTWDEARVISSYVDVIMARLLQHDNLIEMADGSTVPVINGCDNKFHPAQGISDIFTIQEVFGSVEDVHVVYVGIGNNVSNSLTQATLLAGGRFTLCAPQVDPDAFDRDMYLAWSKHPNYKTVNDLEQAVQDADVLYTDTWINMEFFNDPAYAEQKKQRVKMMMPYQINEDVLAMTGNDHTLIMHCMPVHKGYEVNDSIAYHMNSVIFRQAENRLHAEKALLLWLLDAI